MDLVFFGIQGSGKGTQAKKLAEEYGYDIFEAGGELRKIAASDTPLGVTVKKYIDDGHLVPHEIIMQVVSEAISKRQKEIQILFDGIPRDQNQMHDFDAIMQKANRPFCCIQFVLSDEEAKKRILGRATKENRADDANTEIVERRIATFREKTLPVIEAYRMLGKLHEIDADRPVGEIYEDLKKVIEVTCK